MRRDFCSYIYCYSKRTWEKTLSRSILCQFDLTYSLSKNIFSDNSQTHECTTASYIHGIPGTCHQQDNTLYLPYITVMFLLLLPTKQ